MGDDEEPNDDQGGELDFPPEDLFHQDEDDVEITLRLLYTPSVNPAIAWSFP